MGDVERKEEKQLGKVKVKKKKERKNRRKERKRKKNQSCLVYGGCHQSSSPLVEEEVRNAVGFLVKDLLRRHLDHLGVINPQPLPCRMKHIAGVVPTGGRDAMVIGDGIEVVGP
jgi:hypothetical protein